MIEIKRFVFNPFSENTYLIWDKQSSEAMIADPGCLEDYEQEELDIFINQNKLKIKYLVNTHCHIDHSLGNGFVKNKYLPQFYIPELDRQLLEDIQSQGSMFGVEVEKSPAPDAYITEDLILKLGAVPVKFIFTPGHTPGEYCIWFEEEKICFSGDVLFMESIGRTDLWGGSQSALIDSIKNKLFALDDSTVVYPGHGDSTTIGFEKNHNPYMINFI